MDVRRRPRAVKIPRARARRLATALLGGLTSEQANAVEDIHEQLSPKQRERYDDLTPAKLFRDCGSHRHRDGAVALDGCCSTA